MRDKIKKKLQEEFFKGKILRKVGISVPRYLGVAKVQFPTYFTQTLEKQDKHGILQPLHYLSGKIQWGLLIEIVENDLSLISEERVRFYYKKEREKIKKLGIVPIDSSSIQNVLWSPSRRKLYFIDVEGWYFPEELKKTLRWSWLRRIFA